MTQKRQSPPKVMAKIAFGGGADPDLAAAALERAGYTVHRRPSEYFVRLQTSSMTIGGSPGRGLAIDSLISASWTSVLRHRPGGRHSIVPAIKGRFPCPSPTPSSRTGQSFRIGKSELGDCDRFRCRSAVLRRSWVEVPGHTAAIYKSLAIFVGL